MARLAILSDTHFDAERTAAAGTRRTGLADILLRRVVHRLNRYVRPDLTLVLGDLVNDGTRPAGEAQLGTLRRILDLLQMPWLALPGNHDGDGQAFWRQFPALPERLDVAGVRILPFVDPEEPGYNARRRAADLERLTAARDDGWRGPVVTVQHVPLFPPGTHACPYHYLNAAEILERMAQQGIDVAISGHYHPGFGPLPQVHPQVVVAPALCEAPFSYLIVDLGDGTCRTQRQDLAMPAALGLVDAHVHTPLAYCNENMDIALATSLARAFGLAGLRITEHSGHLYFSRRDYGARAFATGLAGARPEDNRMALYRAALHQAQVEPHTWGIEIDADDRGDALIDSADISAFPFRLGAMHHLPGLAPDRGLSEAQVANEFLGVLQRFLTGGYAALAHPFRVFRRAGRAVPEAVIAPSVELLRAAGTAAEINFHTNQPDPRFVRLCLDAGVPLTFGSDAHHLYEVGEFFPHLELLRQAGYDGDPRDVVRPR